MKKLLQLTLAIVLTLSAFQGKAQLSNGSIAPDFNFTDLNGNQQHLYALLDSGFTTYIDISAAWCGPCWAYHNTGALDGLYNTYGPHGTNVLRVLFIEGELTNLTAQLHGITGTATPNTGYNNSTQGDWVSTTAFPIVDLSSSTPGASTFLSSLGYDIAYFPTVYMICPDRSITLVGQATTTALYAAKASCATAVAASDAEMMLSTSLNTTLQNCDSVTPMFRLANVGSSVLTSATITYSVDGVVQKVKPWTGSINTYANTTVVGPKVGSSVPGTHSFTASVSNPNGSTDPTPSNNDATVTGSIYSAAGAGLISESFETVGLPTSWPISNGGAANTWITSSPGFNSSSSMSLPFFNSGVGDVDILTLPSMSFAGMSSPQMTFDVSYAQLSATVSDVLRVEFSTNCGSSWLPRYAKSGSSLSTNGTTYSTFEYTPSQASQWRHETVNLPTYANAADVLVRFKGTSANGNDVFIDNINFAQATGITELNDIGFVNIYPNPASTVATVNFNLTKSSTVSVIFVNAIGQEVLKSDLGSLGLGEQNYTIKTETLSNGIYSVILKTDNGIITNKISVNK